MVMFTAGLGNRLSEGPAGDKIRKKGGGVICAPRAKQGDCPTFRY